MGLERKNLVLKGIPASEGIVAGNAMVISGVRPSVPKRIVSEDKVPEEIERLRKALKEAVTELEEVKEEFRDSMAREVFSIIDAHSLLIQDQSLWKEVERKIREGQINAEWAIRKTIDEWLKVFAELQDQYLRDRAQDIETVGERVLGKMGGNQDKDLRKITDPVIIVAHDLRPDQTAQMFFSKVLGFATDIGSSTSHTAIVARSLEIPAVVGLEQVSRVVEEGDLIILDGIEGKVIINPDDELCQKYIAKKADWEATNLLLQEYASPPSMTQDAHQIQLSANLEILDEIHFLKKYGAEGVGLYRTEYLYLDRQELPNEKEHLENYRKLAKGVSPYPATIRTFDLGGDKFVSEPKVAEEMNPALGLRAIRFCLQRPDIFKAQIRGILRASAFGKIRIMFPLISSLEEVIAAKKILKEAMDELDKEGKKFDPKIKVGIMIEVPSAVMTAERLAEHVDFFSIGTNDLIQYVLAIDRVNEYVNYLYQPLHPAVLQMIQRTVQAGHQAGIEVAMCGEMAGDVFLLPVLVGLGLDQLSMPARLIPKVRKVLKGLKVSEVKPLTEELLKLSTSEQIKTVLQERIEKDWAEAYKMTPPKKPETDGLFLCGKNSRTK